MRTTKKLISVLLTVILTATMALSAFAAPKVVLSGKAGENVTWQLTDDGVLTVSGQGAIVDEALYEYDDEGDIISSQLISSIGMSLSDYFDELTQGLNAAETEKARFNMVKELIVEEGITAIPDDEFGFYFPRKVVLPASLTELGYGIINTIYTEQIIIRSNSLESIQLNFAVCPEGAEPYKNLEEAIQSYVDLCVRQDQFSTDVMPVYALQEIYCLQNGLAETDEEYNADTVLANNNECFGLNAASLDEQALLLLPMVNEHFGTSFQALSELFCTVEDEWGSNVEFSDELWEVYGAETDTLDDTRIETRTLGESVDEVGVTSYGWLTVMGVDGSVAEESCGYSQVNFVALCRFCGQVHGGSFWQSVISAMHKVFYFFAHLFHIM